MTNFLQTHGNPRKGTQWEPKARRPTGPGLTCFTPGRSMSSGFPPPTRWGLLDGRPPLSRSARTKRRRRVHLLTSRSKLIARNRLTYHGRYNLKSNQILLLPSKILKLKNLRVVLENAGIAKGIFRQEIGFISF